MTGDSIVPRHSADATVQTLGWIDSAARKLVRSALSQARIGRLIFREAGDVQAFGDPGYVGDIDATIHVRDARLWRSVALGGALGAGEAYMKGWWAASDLTRAIRFFIANAATLKTMNTGLARLLQPLHRIFHQRRENTRTGSRRNIAAHYDLGNDFYQLWLDETMAYSAGIFETPAATMREASIAKMDRLCRKLRLSPCDHLVEIGTGWGGLAIYAAQNFGCRVTTTTISQRQYEFARERIASLGLSDRITLLLEDYRDLRGQFDKLVSVEMIEAVGHQYFDTFFRKVASLLRPSGLASIQAITVADRFYEHARRDVDFIKRYIFPGSCLPSIAVMSDSIARVTDMTMTHLEDITSHYARTLQRWRDTFLARQDRVHALGLPQSFVRMWEFYLSYCEAGFAERTIGTVQLTMAKPAAAHEPILGRI